jgi:lipoprotein-releasing system ATP-binding protein
MHTALKGSFLLVTHDPRLAARCVRMIELIDGRIERDEAVAAARHPEPLDARAR